MKKPPSSKDTTRIDAPSRPRKPCIVQMVEAFEQVGGPPKLVRLIVESPLREIYDFHIVTYIVSGMNLSAVWQLRRQLVRFAPDVVHIHGLKADGFLATLAARLAGVRSILLVIHGSSLDALDDYRTASMRVRQWVVGHILEPVSLRLAHAVYCVCEAMKRNARIRRHAGRRLCETIHNGIVPTPGVARNGHLRQSLGFADDDVVLIYAGRMSTDKGLGVLAAAMQRVVRSGQASPKLLLVGDGPDSAVIRACFQSLIDSRHVVMTGRRDDVDGLNALSDIFVFPSFHENLSFAVLEAMNAGLPVIATAVGGNVEIVVDDSTGRLVPPHDIDSLAQAIADLAGNAALRASMGAAGKLRLRQEFNAAAVIQKTEALYKSLLSKTITASI
jgi:glycosyltransferase involved in cell wall biosynthesis